MIKSECVHAECLFMVILHVCFLISVFDFVVVSMNIFMMSLLGWQVFVQSEDCLVVVTQLRVMSGFIQLYSKMYLPGIRGWDSFCCCSVL